MKRAMGVILVGVTVAMLMIAGRTSAEDDARGLEGKPAGDFKFQTLQGKTIELSKEKGNVVVLDYWATWCPPCRHSLPHLQKLSADEDRAAKGLKVYGINDKEKLPIIKNFLKQNNYTFNVGLDPMGKFGQQYNVHTIPTTVIVGRDGVIKSVFVGYGSTSDERMEAAIDQALAEGK